MRAKLSHQLPDPQFLLHLTQLILHVFFHVFEYINYFPGHISDAHYSDYLKLLLFI